MGAKRLFRHLSRLLHLLVIAGLLTTLALVAWSPQPVRADTAYLFLVAPHVYLPVVLRGR